jgi:hypothetical protein
MKEGWKEGYTRISQTIAHPYEGNSDTDLTAPQGSALAMSAAKSDQKHENENQ